MSEAAREEVRKAVVYVLQGKARGTWYPHEGCETEGEAKDLLYRYSRHVAPDREWRVVKRTTTVTDEVLGQIP